MKRPQPLHIAARFCLTLLAATAAMAVHAARLTVSVSNQAGAPPHDVVVYALPEGGKPKGAARPGTIDQVNKAFVPQVVVVQAGAAVSFPNKDNIRHHVYSFSPARTFELKLYSGLPSKPVVFDKPGPVTLGCNIHDAMLGFIYVVDTPYFGKSNEHGVAVLDELPAGVYELRIWHPFQNAEVPGQKLRLGARDDQRIDLRIALTPPEARTK